MPRLAHLSAPAALALALLLSPAALAADVVEEARALLSKGDPYAAVDRLEKAVPEADPDHLPALLDVLRSAYETAAERAESEGKTREAKHYREGRKLLQRPEPEPIAVEPMPEPDSKAEAGKPEAAPRDEAPTASTPEESPKPEPEGPSPVSELRRADEFWKAKKYVEAGEIYAALARAEKLPPQRRDHWAYCRLVSVLEKINAGPPSPAAWSEIHAEIDHIRLLSPKNWYAEYLRNVVIERSGGVRAARRDRDALVVRGAAPDDPVAAKRSARPSGTKSPATAKADPGRSTSARRDEPTLPKAPPEARLDAPAPARTAPATIADAPIGRPGPADGEWKTFITPNFRILHQDEALARKVAGRAEATRRAAVKLWTGGEPKSAWAPKCDIFLFPTAESFAEQTGQPPESPGFSTAGLEGGRVVARMVKLRVDFDRMVDAVLPHEVTHVVLADLFPAQQIPRWADEGMAVLSEPAGEQANRVRDLAEPIRDDVLFRLDVLMTTDYPAGTHWPLYYAQSVSLTRYLVSLGSPQQFVKFVRATQTQGIDPALKSVYKIESVAQLEQRWKVHAREAVRVASSGSESKEESGSVTR